MAMTTTFVPALAFIGNFHGGEIILIFLIVLLLFGAKKVPELFRSLGKGVNEFRKAKNDWEQDIQDVMSQEPLEDHDFKEKPKEANQSVPTEEEKQSAN
jgi:sec-independent protein translocase protein TatA